MDKHQAKQLLLNNPHHYLWDKDFKSWTKKDIESLQTEFKKPRKKYKAISKQAVKATFQDGEVIHYRSIAEAERDLGINECTIRSNLSGRQKTAKGIKFEKL